MDQDEREIIIQEAGRVTADKLQEAEDQLREIHTFFGVVRVAHTKGFVLEASQDGANAVNDRDKRE